MRALAIFFWLLASAALAQDARLLPEIPKAIVPPAVPHPDDIRINHMEYLRHDRDETVYQGDRAVTYSLAACVTCHAVRLRGKEFATIEDDRHFCKACHIYAAVKIDCFQCHNSVPNDEIILLGRFGPENRQELFDFLQELGE